MIAWQRVWCHSTFSVASAQNAGATTPPVSMIRKSLRNSKKNWRNKNKKKRRRKKEKKRKKSRKEREMERIRRRTMEIRIGKINEIILNFWLK